MSKKGSKKSPFLIYKKRGEDYLLREKIEGLGEYIVIFPEAIFSEEDYPVLKSLKGKIRHIKVTKVYVEPSRRGMSVDFMETEIAIAVDPILRTFIRVKDKEGD